MNRQKILIAACALASISVGVNVWLLSRKKDDPAPVAAVQQKAEPEVRLGTEMDFNGTGLQDGAWKLDDDGAGKKVPVFESTGLTNDSWKLGDGKEKEKGPDPGPSVGPPKNEVPPPPSPAPQTLPQ